LLRVLLARQMITANDAERLGLILLAQGDLFGARDALVRFDETANPERTTGRLALFEVLVQIGDKSAALSKAASWIGFWHKARLNRAPGAEATSTRLMRMMLAVDERAARRLICDAQRKAAAEVDEDDDDAPPRDRTCDLKLPGVEAGAGTVGNAVTSTEPRDDLGRKRKRR
jgi:hypothetical protein